MKDEHRIQDKVNSNQCKTKKDICLKSTEITSEVLECVLWMLEKKVCVNDELIKEKGKRLLQCTNSKLPIEK